MRIHRYRPWDQVTNYPELPINKTTPKSIDQLNDNAASPTRPRENHGAYRQPSGKFGKNNSVRRSEKSTAQHEAKAAECEKLDGGILEKEQGTPRHRQAKNVETAADHTHTRVARHATLPTARIVATAANWTTSRSFARVKQKRRYSDRQNQADAAKTSET